MDRHSGMARPAVPPGWPARVVHAVSPIKQE